MRSLWKGASTNDEGDPLLRREREVLQFLEAHGLDTDAKLSRERLGVMEAAMTAPAAAAS